MAEHLEKMVKSTLMTSGDFGFSKNSSHIVTQCVILERKKCEVSDIFLSLKQTYFFRFSMPLFSTAAQLQFR